MSDYPRNSSGIVYLLLEYIFEGTNSIYMSLDFEMIFIKFWYEGDILKNLFQFPEKTQIKQLCHYPS